jgi:structure-specific endonuclease subunit SLX1
MTRHIPEDDRLFKAKKVQKRSWKTGAVRTKIIAPPMSMEKYVRNLRLLLKSSSFERWPLSLTFYSEDVYRHWGFAAMKDGGSVRSGIEIQLSPNAPPAPVKRKNDEVEDGQKVGEVPLSVRLDPIAQLNFTYSGTKSYLEKSRATFASKNSITCAVCKNEVTPEGALVVVCPHSGCEAVSHLQCLSTEFLGQEISQGRNGDLIVPVEGQCPNCHIPTKWTTLVQELSLRMRGQKEVGKLFKEPRQKRGDASNTVEAALAAEGFKDIDEIDIETDESEDERRFDEFEAAEIRNATKELSEEPLEGTPKKWGKKSSNTGIKDSDWEDAEVLD